MKQRVKYFKVLLFFLGLKTSLLMAQDYIVPSMVTIPAGEFMMGHESDPKARPVHKVNIAKFYMSKYPVTIHEFRKFALETGFNPPANCNDFMDKEGLRGPTFEGGTGKWDKNSRYYNDFQPVTCLTWKDIQAYVKWLNQKTGGSYRLPTEEEWEYAVKGGTNTRYFWGDDLTYAQAHLYGNVADQNVEYTTSNSLGYTSQRFIPSVQGNDGEAFNSIVGMYRPNPYGLYDMFGNVGELLNSCYYESGYDLQHGTETDPNKCEYIASRGSNWHYPAVPYFHRGRIKREGWQRLASSGFRLASDVLIDAHASTQDFEDALEQAIKHRIATRHQMIEAPKKVSLEPSDNGGYLLSWQLVQDSRVVSYEVYKPKYPYAHMEIGYFKEVYEKLKTVSAKTHTIRINKEEKKTSFIVVAVSEEMTSLPSTVLAEKEPTTVSIPGKIQPYEFLEAENMPLHHLPAEGDLPEDYYFFKTNLSFENKPSSVSFDVEVAKSGWYRFNYRGSSRIKGKFFDVWLGNRLAATIDFDPDRNDRVSKKHRLYLEKGKHVLQLTMMKEVFDRWGLGWLEFTEIEDLSSSN